MANSGVSVKDECVEVFQDIKMKQAYQYAIFALTKDLKEIEVIKKGDKGASYDDFKLELKNAESAQECRYAIYDCQYVTKSGQNNQKIAFFMWSPENAKMKQKMVYASSKDSLKKKLVGVGAAVQACDFDDLSWDSLLEKIK